VLVSALATYLTQRAVIRNQTTPAEGQAAMIQRLMLVGIPVSVIVSGFIFPLGVLLYWFTSNLWTLGQQYYIFRYHPHIPATATAGAGGGTLSQPAGKALAPKVGQKPVKPKGSRPGTAPQVAGQEGAGTPAGASAMTGSNGKLARSNGARVDLSKADPGDRSSDEPAAGAGAAVQPSSSTAGRGSRPAGNRPGNKRSPGKKRR
jgi:YidC/Oxa1 family membrane protein insertase